MAILPAHTADVTVGLDTKSIRRDGEDTLVTVLTIRAVPYDDSMSALDIELAPAEMMAMLSGRIILKKMRVSGRAL